MCNFYFQLQWEMRFPLPLRICIHVCWLQESGSNTGGMPVIKIFQFICDRLRNFVLFRVFIFLVNVKLSYKAPKTFSLMLIEKIYFNKQSKPLFFLFNSYCPQKVILKCGPWNQHIHIREFVRSDNSQSWPKVLPHPCRGGLQGWGFNEMSG